MEFINKADLLAEIEKLIDKGKYSEEYDCAYRDGNNGALYALTGKIKTLEVKEADLENECAREIAREKSILDETKVEYFATGNPTIAAYSEDNLRNQFNAGADWMKEQIIKILKEK